MQALALRAVGLGGDVARRPLVSEEETLGRLTTLDGADAFLA